MQPAHPITPLRRLVFRVAQGQDAGHPLPFNVRSVGHYRLAPGHVEIRQPGTFAQLFWTVRGHGRAHLKNQTFDAAAHDVFFYQPGETHHLVTAAEGWEYRWLTLDGPDVKRALTLLALPRHRTAGTCPARSFELLETLLQHPTGAAAREASLAAYAILEAAGRTAPSARAGGSGVAEAARHALDENFADPTVGIDAVARTLRVHRTTLLRDFSAVHGVSPSTYLARRRLQHALALLRTTSQPVADIAAAAGFRSAEYLARVVREATGQSPRDFRRS